MKRSKAYTAVAEKVDADKLYGPGEALDFAKSNTKAKFDETVDVSMRLGVDPRKADQMVRGTVNLPNGTGKTARVLVFATGRSRRSTRVPTRSGPTSSSPRWPAATSTSTPSSRRRT
jgi:ribosomal protein L1